MFTNPLAERDASCVHLHDVNADVMRHVINFIYTGETQVTNDNAQDLMAAGALFDLPHLIGLCTEHVIREICISNCVELFAFSSHFVCEKLRECVKQYILDHFMEVIYDDRFVDLHVDHLDELLSEDDLCIGNEEVLFEALAKWTAVEKTRVAYFPKLFKHIRIALLKESYINQTVRQHIYVMNNPLCQQILRKYDRYKAQQNINETHSEVNLALYDLNTTPRHGMFNRLMLVFSGGTSSKSNRSLTAFDPVMFKNYIGVQPHATFDFDHKVDFYQLVSVLNNKLYFIGGVYYEEYRTCDTAGALSEVYQYNIKSMAWEPRCSLSTPRCCFAVAVAGKKIYAIGGKPQYPRGNPTDSVEVYDTDDDTWTAVSPVPITIYAHSAAATTECDVVYVFGGKDEDDEFLDTVFRYHVLRDTWTLVTTQMPKPRAFCSSYSYKGDFYIVGGLATRENILSVSIYDHLHNEWRSGNKFPEERQITGTGFHDGIIYVCGGVRHLGISGRRSREVESRDLFKYDMERNTWSKVVKLVQYGNNQSMEVTMLNTKFLNESDFISSL